MEKPWEKPFKNREEAKAALSQMGLMGHIFFFAGVIFVILGVVGGAMKTTIGLESTIWLLIAIAVFLASLPCWITWAVAMHLLGIGSEK